MNETANIWEYKVANNVNIVTIHYFNILVHQSIKIKW